MLNIKQLGVTRYLDTLALMRDYTDSRDEFSRDELWLLQHEPVFTQGQAGKKEHVLCAGDIPVVQSDRGGQITYHGPGQLVCYVLVDIKRARDALKNDPFIKHYKAWQKAVDKMLTMGVRVEQQALAKHGLEFVADTYLPEKLQQIKSFLP